MTERATSWAPPNGRGRDAHAGQHRRVAWLLLVLALFGITGAVTLFSSRPLR